MAQHKAPTAVTIAPVSEKAGFAEVVDRFWKPALAVAVLVAGFLLYRTYSSNQVTRANSQSWDALDAALQRDAMGGFTGDSAKLAAAADAAQGKSAGPWALYMAASSAATEQKFEDAKRYITRLRQEFPTHALVVDKQSFTADGPRLSAAEDLEARVDAQIAWRAQHPMLFANPELPANAPRVKVNTNEGSFVIGLYTDAAPRHAENFLRLAKEGAYTGIKFHRVKSGVSVEGDPNTLKDDVTTWGSGGAGAELEDEANALKHFSGAVGAVRLPGSSKSNGSQFYMMVGEDHARDGKSVVFGKVVEGLDVLKRLSELKTVAGTDRPEMPPTIQSVEVL